MRLGSFNVALDFFLIVFVSFTIIDCLFLAACCNQLHEEFVSLDTVGRIAFKALPSRPKAMSSIVLQGFNPPFR